MPCVYAHERNTSKAYAMVDEIGKWMKEAFVVVDPARKTVRCNTGVNYFTVRRVVNVDAVKRSVVF